MKQLVFYSLLAGVFVSAIQVVVARHESRKLFIEIQALEQTRDRLNEEWGRLQLEQSTWATDARIESLSKTVLDMESPEMNAIVLIEK